MPRPAPQDPHRPTPAPAVRRWALAAATLAPIGMIGGWTLAAARQESDFDAVRETISALAAQTATLPVIMTAGLALTGVGHVATALALRPAARPGRLLLAAGGVATALVAALPVDASPRAHGLAAAVAFGALSVWPVAAARSGTTGVLGRRTGAVATGVLLALLAWFVVELQGLGPDDGAATGLAERAVAAAQSLWPLVVVLALRSARGGRRSTASAR
ncbi:DUF998 domain-containing protein [Pengzhenrongella sicca]|uniref:DUF998 domain-containing protein n=1 Tax=Pengzhenrongella sicca TaxID=2819238 RepID=A0A8A4ZIT1_9MICO|nr:DUF998 domain-containing protein [Pengzhenrongella sicca]QTE30427.1 DUF998 domain-containing protein [Pengzhenrongella sicca]